MHRRETDETRRSDLEETWLEGGVGSRRFNVSGNAIRHHEFLDGFSRIFSRVEPREIHRDTRVPRPENSKHWYENYKNRGESIGVDRDGSKNEESWKNSLWYDSLWSKGMKMKWNLWSIFVDMSEEEIGKSMYLQCLYYYFEGKYQWNISILYHCIFDISRLRTYMRICIFHMLYTLFMNIINIIRYRDSNIYVLHLTFLILRFFSIFF